MMELTCGPCVDEKFFAYAKTQGLCAGLNHETNYLFDHNGYHICEGTHCKFGFCGRERPGVFLENAAVDFADTKYGTDSDTKAGSDTKADTKADDNVDDNVDDNADDNADYDSTFNAYNDLDQVSAKCRGAKGKKEAVDVKADRLAKPTHERSTTKDARENFIMTSCRSEDEFRMKQSIKRKELKAAADKKEEDLRKSQGPLKKAAMLKAKSDARDKAQHNKISGKAGKASQSSKNATTGRRPGAAQKAAVNDAMGDNFAFGDEFIESPRHRIANGADEGVGARTHTVGSRVLRAKFRRASLDEFHTGTRLSNPDGNQGYLDVGKGANISGPGTKTYIVQTVDVETGLVSNCPTDATDFTVKPWDEDYIEAKVAVFPGGANSGDLDAYNSGQLDGENKRVASDSDDDDDDEPAPSKFSSKSVGCKRKR